MKKLFERFETFMTELDRKDPVAGFFFIIFTAAIGAGSILTSLVLVSMISPWLLTVIPAALVFYGVRRIVRALNGTR